jgi:hypothetical protein
MDSDRTVSWMAIDPEARVLDAEGNDIGKVEKVIGDDGRDIFHGLAIDLKGWGGHVELPADRITRITTHAVHTDLGPAEAESLEKQ